MEKKWAKKEQLIDLLCDLVSIPSITGSQAEIDLPGFVVNELHALPYFQKHEEHLQKVPTGDGRYFVAALVKKRPDVKDTIILISHFDVVDVEDYGAWKELAFKPKELTDLFYKNKEELPPDVQREIKEGNWLFGRGTMDMKCGLAMHMAMIEQACSGKFDGNLLLLTVPDEEVNSIGMRAAVPFLNDFAKKNDLTYITVLNSEPMFTRYPGDQNHYIYTGTIGKVLPGFLCYGKETHVGEPFSGLNGNLMASLLTAELELNTDFCEKVEGDVTPPPTNLIQRDLKEDYSVQIPHRAVTLFNLFLFEKTMEEIVEPLRQTALSVAEKIKSSYAAHAESFAKLDAFTPPELNVNVLTYEELLNYAVKNYGKEEVERIHAISGYESGKDDRDATIKRVDQLAILCKELSPMIVLFFAPPYYPAVCSRNHPLIQQVSSEMMDDAIAKHGVTLKQQNYFGGISDLSYVGLAHPAETLHPLVANMPLWNNGYSLPLDDLEQFNVPVLNLGPVGRDAHQRHERLNVDYAFETLLDLLPVCIEKLFSANQRSSLAG
ncbi:M20/M25/M40 family metallo-hydrolase [Fictibacillus gelatini]|uniref:M20/M25/M40 family metallo-hydrolase n=1 Tax=Fictibacillus gelatini TaxID=225985 RepID=UPI00040FF316|nr:M20/M25/M40 family metallo-hydrolase [Fictibacillus gelatini]